MNMKNMPALTGLVLIQILLKFCTATGAILSPPETTVGYVGHRVSFNCTVPVGYDISWYLTDNHLRSNHLTGVPYQAATSRLDRQIIPSSLTSILTIDASSQTNNTLIICKASSMDSFNTSDGVYTINQGRLSAPGNLTSIVSNDSISLNWNPPFSHAHIPSYAVSMFGQTVTTTSNSYHFMMSEYNVSQCNSELEIVFEIYGLNPVGEGDVATIIVHVPRDSQRCIQDPPTSGRTPTASLPSGHIPTLTLCQTSGHTLYQSSGRTPTLYQTSERTPTLYQTSGRTPTLYQTSGRTPTVSLPSGRETIYIYSGAAAVLLTSIIVIIGVLACMCCCLAHKISRKNQVHGTPTTAFEMSQNPTYAVIQCSTQQNPAYTTVGVTEVHHYDTIGAPPVYATIGGPKIYGEFQSA